jgi:hypothetical protein
MKRNILFTMALAALLPAAFASQEQLAKSIRDTHVETITTSEQLRATLGALNALTKQTKGDLHPAYNAFRAQAAKTQTAAVETRKRVAWMNGDGRKYFFGWQESVNGIANESLRKKAQKRLDSVKESYGKVEEKLKVASEKFSPFLSDLTDIEKALATDVTAGGVKAIRSTVKSANWNYQFVNDSITSARKEMDKMEKALSTQAR